MRILNWQVLGGLLSVVGCASLGGDLSAAQVGARPVPLLVNPATARLPAARPYQRSSVDYNRIEARIHRLMARPEMVGMAIAVVEQGQISYIKGFGLADTASAAPVGTRTVFRWASLSKGVAATIVAELADEGKLSLRDPVSRWAPSLKLPGGAENRVTVADVLAHRLGITRNAYDNKLEAGGEPHALRRALSTLPQYCAPATCHTYQNVAFDAASEIVETVTGKPYETVARERLFGPLGMRSATISRAGLLRSGDWAKPHIGRTPVGVSEPYYRVPAAGGVNSSIFDLAQWLTAQMGDAQSVVPTRVLQEIHRPRVATDRRTSEFTRAMSDQNYALGWRKYTYSTHTLIGHQGAVRGYRAAILFDPDRQTGLAILWNSGSGRPIGLQLEILDSLYGIAPRDWMKIDAPVLPAA